MNVIRMFSDFGKFTFLILRNFVYDLRYFYYTAYIPDTADEWLDEFSTFSIYQVLPKVIELWGLNVQTQVESKKNFDQLTGK